jgi:hypothetical protein
MATCSLSPVSPTQEPGSDILWWEPRVSQITTEAICVCFFGRAPFRVSKTNEHQRSKLFTEPHPVQWEETSIYFAIKTTNNRTGLCRAKLHYLMVRRPPVVRENNSIGTKKEVICMSETLYYFNSKSHGWYSLNFTLHSKFLKYSV